MIVQLKKQYLYALIFMGSLNSYGSFWSCVFDGIADRLLSGLTSSKWIADSKFVGAKVTIDYGKAKLLELAERLDLTGVPFKIAYKKKDKILLVEMPGNGDKPDVDFNAVLRGIQWIQWEPQELATTPVLGSLETLLLAQDYDIPMGLIISKENTLIKDQRLRESQDNLKRRLFWQRTSTLKNGDLPSSYANRHLATASAWLESNSVAHKITVDRKSGFLTIEILPDKQSALGRLATSLNQNKVQLVYSPERNNRLEASAFFDVRDKILALSNKEIRTLRPTEFLVQHEIYHFNFNKKRDLGIVDRFSSEVQGDFKKLHEWDPVFFKQYENLEGTSIYEQFWSLEEIFNYSKGIQLLGRRLLKSKSDNLTEDTEVLLRAISFLQTLSKRTQFVSTVSEAVFNGALNESKNVSFRGKNFKVQAEITKPDLGKFRKSGDNLYLQNTIGISIRDQSLVGPIGPIGFNVYVASTVTSPFEISNLGHKSVAGIKVDAQYLEPVLSALTQKISELSGQSDRKKKAQLKQDISLLLDKLKLP